MPKYYCDYCDIYLSDDSKKTRRKHCQGRNHLANIRHYYGSWMQEQVEQTVRTAFFKSSLSVIDSFLIRSIKQGFNSVQEGWGQHPISFLLLLDSSMWIFRHLQSLLDRPTSFSYLMLQLISPIINSEYRANIFLLIVDLIHRCIACVSKTISFSSDSYSLAVPFCF